MGKRISIFLTETQLRVLIKNHTEILEFLKSLKGKLEYN